METPSKKQVSITSKIQKELMLNTNIIDQPDANFQYLKKPLGKAIFMHTYLNEQNGDDTEQNEDETEQKKQNYYEWYHQRYICPVCGTEIYKGNKSKHANTNKHKLYKKVTDKIAKGILGD